MKSTVHTLWDGFVRAALAVGVVACLCFSTGEGLRLTPLPTHTLDEAGASGLRVGVSLAREASLHRAGPLDVPAPGQAQKRGKRQAPDCDGPPSGGARDIPFQILWRPGDGRHPVLSARRPGARPPGRAPPLTA